MLNPSVALDAYFPHVVTVGDIIFLSSEQKKHSGVFCILTSEHRAQTVFTLWTLCCFHDIGGEKQLHANTFRGFEPFLLVCSSPGNCAASLPTSFCPVLCVTVNPPSRCSVCLGQHLLSIPLILWVGGGGGAWAWVRVHSGLGSRTETHSHLSN